MASLKIKGGGRLQGEIIPQGAKNEAMQILCACLLTEDKVTIHNLPDILDINNLIALLEGMGVNVERPTRHDIIIQAKSLNFDYFKGSDYQTTASKLRGSVMMTGPMLARFGKAYMPKPGGDKIGRRRLDTHVIGLQKLGAIFDFDSYQVGVQQGGLKGCYMLLDEASVTGTANIVMAAVMAEGTTTIFNAACEPYLVQLCNMLNSMGANITGVGSNLLTIEGVSSLHGTDHTLLADMIEVGSFIGMAAMTGSEITIKNAGINHEGKNELGIIPDVFRKLGIQMNTVATTSTSPHRNITRCRPSWTAASSPSPMRHGPASPPTSSVSSWWWPRKPKAPCSSTRRCLRAVCSSSTSLSTWVHRSSSATRTAPTSSASTVPMPYEASAWLRPTSAPASPCSSPPSQPKATASSTTATRSNAATNTSTSA